MRGKVENKIFNRQVCAWRLKLADCERNKVIKMRKKKEVSVYVLCYARYLFC